MQGSKQLPSSGVTQEEEWAALCALVPVVLWRGPLVARLRGVHALSVVEAIHVEEAVLAVSLKSKRDA